MKKILQYFWLFVFAIFVVGLGIFAYKISSDTLVFAFRNSEDQTGKTMILAFDKPWTLSKIIPSGKLIDIEAIKKSMFYNGSPVSENDLKNFDFNSTDSFIEIIPKNSQNGDVLRISSLVYSDNKKTSYQLPQDIILKIDDSDTMFTVTNSDLPNEMETFVTNIPENISPQNILWYVYYPKNNEQCYYNDIFWDAYRFSQVHATQDTNNENIFHLNIDSKKNICLVAGISNKIIPVLDRKLNNLTYTVNVSQILDDEENIQNQIEFKFSSPILPDPNKNIEEYKNLKNQKIIQIIQHSYISPHMELSEKNIDITSDSLRIIWDFQNNEKYAIHIEQLQDIYGRDFFPKFSFTPQNSPFLSLNTDKNQQQFQNFSDISAKIFAISPVKDEYDVKMCRMDAYGFARLNQIYSEKNKQNLEEVYEILASSHATNCQKQPIKIHKNSSFTSFRPIEIFDAKNLRPGFYVLAFQNIQDIHNFENFVAPFPFAVANSRIQAVFNHKSQASFLVTDSFWNTLPNQEIEILKKIPWKNWNFSYTTGSIIWITNKEGFINKNLQEFSDSEVLFITRWEKKFWYFFSWIPFFDSFNPDLSVKFFTNGDIFHKNETLNISAILTEGESILKNQKIFAELLSENNDSLKKTTLISNDFWVIAFDFTFNDSLHYGKYFLKISRENKDGNIEYIGEKEIIFSEQDWKKYWIEAKIRFLNTENSVPKNLLEKLNTNDKISYYKNIYSASIQSEIIARAYDENGQILKNSPFQYKIFRKKISESNEEKELIKDWIANFDSDGLGFVTEKIEFETFYHDVEYFLEVNIKDPKNSEISQGFSQSVVKIPFELQTFDDSLKPEFSLSKEIFTKNDIISFQFSNELWTKMHHKKYRFDLLDESNNVLYTAEIVNQKVEIPKLPLHSGIYQIKVYPVTPEGIIPTENTIIYRKFLITSEEGFSFKNAEIFSNISDKRVENIITSPAISGKILIAYSYNDEINTDYFSFSGNTIPYSILMENFSGKIHFSSIIQSTDGQNFFSEKFIQIPEKNEKININFSKNNSEKNNFSAQISLVDEKNNAISWNAIIRIFEWNPTSKNFENIFKRENYSQLGFIGNIFQKNIEIFSDEKRRENIENFQKNLYFSPSISSNKNGQITFNVENFSPKKDYYIEVFAYTNTGKSGYFIQKFENKKDFDFSVQIPEFLYVWDRPSIRFSAKNNTQTIVHAIPKIEFRNNDESLIFTGSLFLNLDKNEELLLPIRFPEHWHGSVDYTASLEKNDTIISHFDGQIFLETIPTMWLSQLHIFSGVGKSDVKIFSDPLYNKEQSKIQIFASESLAAFIPKYLNDIYFSPKITKADIFSDFYIRSKLAWDKDFSYLINKDSLQNEMTDFFQKNPKIFQENKNFSRNLENIEKIARLANIGFFSQNNIIFEMKKYISQAIEAESENFKNDENVKIFLIQTLLNEKIDEEKFSQIQLDSLSQNAFLNYLEILTLKKKEISHEIFDLYFARFNANFEAEILPNSFRKQNAKIAKILLENNKTEKFREILPKFFGDSNAILSVSEMVELIDLALIHNKKTPSNIAKITLQSGIITASDDLNNEKKIISWNLESSKLSDIISLSTSGKWEIFYAIFEENILEAPALFPSRNSDFLETTTTIEKVYEMAWFDENGNYRALEKISDNNLEKNALYKVTTSVKVKNMKDKKWKNLALKIFTFPGSEIFYQNKKTEKIIFEKNFNLQKIKPYNYFLQAEKEGSAGNAEFSYSYFFRPKIEGSYLLPGNFVYFIDGKEFFANSSHNYFHVQ